MEPLRDARGLTEAEAIARYRSRNYPKPALTADILVFSRKQKEHKILLIRRKGHPFLGYLALPGGFANENEPVELTAARELEEETGIYGLPVKLIGIYSAPGRDPRGWVVSAAYAAVAEAADLKPVAGDDAAEVGWYDFRIQDGRLILAGNGIQVEESQLAFDHARILKDAISALF